MHIDFAMQNYNHENIGELINLDQYVFDPANSPLRLESKLFLKEQMGLTGMEVSLNKDAPGTGMNFFHRHNQNEELYVFIGGEGEMQIDGDRFAVSEGSVVRVEPEASRSWWNTGDQDLYYVVIQARKGTMDTSTGEDGGVVEGEVPWK